MTKKILIIFLLFLSINLLKVFAVDINIDTYIYKDNVKLSINDTWVDIGKDGYVIDYSPKDKLTKLNFVKTLLNIPIEEKFTKNNPVIFTKLYLFKKQINMDFQNLDNSDIDKFSWANKTYKNLIKYIKNKYEQEKKVELYIKSWQELTQEEKEEIIYFYKIATNKELQTDEIQYIPFKLIFNIKEANLIENNDKAISSNNTEYTTIKSKDNNINSDNPKNNNSINKNNNKLYKLAIILIISGFILIILNIFLILKYNKLPNDIILQNKSNKVKVTSPEFKFINQRITALEDDINFIKTQISKLTELKKSNQQKELKQDSKINKTTTKKTIRTSLKEENRKVLNTIENNFSKLLQLFKENNLESKLLTIKFNKLKLYIEDLRKYLDLYGLEGYDEKFDNFVKKRILDFIDIIDTIDIENLNIEKQKEDLLSKILLAIGLKEILIIPYQTKVDLYLHKVIGQKSEPDYPKHTILEVKVRGFKYKNIVIRRASVIENV